MEVGCYSMDLYCDQDNFAHEHQEFPHVYTGRTRSDCRRQAIKDGWMYHVDGDVSCPKCSGKKKRKRG